MAQFCTEAKLSLLGDKPLLPELEAWLLHDGKLVPLYNPPTERGLIKSRPRRRAVTVALPVTCENATAALSNAQAPGAFPALGTLLRAAPAARLQEHTTKQHNVACHTTKQIRGFLNQDEH